MCPSYIEDVHKEQCQQDISIQGEYPSTQASTEKVKKKGRGATKCVEINNLEEKIEIDINERNQPIGPNSMKLSSLLGVLAREMFPINYSNWRKVLDQLKEDFWKIINVSIRHYVYLFSTFLFLDDFEVSFQTMYDI